MLKLTILLTVLISHSYERPVKSIALSTASNRFGLNLINRLSNDINNVFISPFSIATAFGMLYSGAKGQTAQEIREVVGYNFGHLSDQQIEEQILNVLKDIESVDSNKYELSVANKVVVQKNFNILQTFKEIVENYYKSSVETFDFINQPQEAMESINKWVGQQTHHKIEKLLEQPLSPSTRLVLLNAVYFKGLFQTKFLKNETQQQTFLCGDEQQTDVSMMRRTGKFNFTEIEEIDSKLLEIPYSGDDISLYILLPNQRQGLRKLKTTLNDFSVIEKSITNLREREVVVNLPKFKIETSYSLKNSSIQLGMNSVFSLSADLSGIDGRQDLFVSDVLHKAYIEVTEEGTEAAGVSGIIIGHKSLPFPIPIREEFIADHPFMFLIRNNRNGMVLFSGHFNKV